MEIEAIKTWQWMMIGLFAGLVFSGICAWSGPGFDTQARDTIEQGEFENSTFIHTKFGQVPGYMGQLVNQFHKDQPLLRDVTVHPPIAGDPHHYWVTGRSYTIGVKPVDAIKRDSPNKVVEEWKLFKFPAAVPYIPGYELRDEKKLDRFANTRRNAEIIELKKSLGGQTSFPTVVEYLKAAQSLPENGSFSFHYAWWELPIPKFTLPPLAGFLMIGVAWPLSLSALQNYGLAKPPVKKVKAVPAPVEKKPVRAPSRAMPAGVVIAAKVPAAPIESEHKEYGGEFYPVVKATHKE